MKAQRKLGLAVSWPRITAVFLIDVAILAIASHCPDAWYAGHAAWWVGVGLAVVVTVVAMLTYRGFPLASAPFARVRNWYADPEELTIACTQPIDHQRRFGRDTVGVREYDGRLVAVVEVEGAPETAAGRHRHHETSAGILPLEVVAGALRQFDIRLDGIDIVSVGTRSAGSVGDQPRRLDQRNTWLVLRMDPQRNVAAVAARDSVASTLVAATERLAHDLDGRSCTARPLTADEILDVDDAVLAGLQPAQIRPFWRQLRTPDGYVTSFWVSPADISWETMDQLWRTDTDVTVVTIRLVARGKGAELSAWVRYHSDKRLRKELWSGLNRLTGRQLEAVGESLPAPSWGRPLTMPSRVLGDGEEIAVPAGAAATPSMVPVGAPQ